MGFSGSGFLWARKNGIVPLFGCCNLEFIGRVDYGKSGHANNRCFGEMWCLMSEEGMWFQRRYRRDTVLCAENGFEKWDGFEDD